MNIDFLLFKRLVILTTIMLWTIGLILLVLVSVVTVKKNFEAGGIVGDTFIGDTFKIINSPVYLRAVVSGSEVFIRYEMSKNQKEWDGIPSSDIEKVYQKYHVKHVGIRVEGEK